VPSRRPLARIALGVGAVLAGMVALAGCIALGGAGLIAVAVAVGVSATLAAGVARESPGGDRSAVREAAWRTGAGTLAVLLLIAGTAALAGGVIAALVTGLGAVAALLRWLQRPGRTRRIAGRWSASAGPARAGGPVQAPAPWGPVAAVPPVPARETWSAPVSALPTSALGREWLRTTAALAGRLDPAARQAIVRRRQEALDELEQRDAAGFARWLATGPAAGSDPASWVRGNVRGDQAAGTDAA
jgi:hypothetical protein